MANLQGHSAVCCAEGFEAKPRPRWFNGHAVRVHDQSLR